MSCTNLIGHYYNYMANVIYMKEQQQQNMKEQQQQNIKNRIEIKIVNNDCLLL